MALDFTQLLSNVGAGASGFHDAAFLENQRQQEDQRFASEQQQREAQTEEQQMQLADQRRQFQANADDRAVAMQYAHDSAPGFYPTVEHDGTITPPAGPPAATASQVA